MSDYRIIISKSRLKAMMSRSKTKISNINLRMIVLLIMQMKINYDNKSLSTMINTTMIKMMVIKVLELLMNRESSLLEDCHKACKLVNSQIISNNGEKWTM